MNCSLNNYRNKNYKPYFKTTRGNIEKWESKPNTKQNNRTTLHDLIWFKLFMQLNCSPRQKSYKTLFLFLVGPTIFSKKKKKNLTNLSLFLLFFLLLLPFFWPTNATIDDMRVCFPQLKTPKPSPLSGYLTSIVKQQWLVNIDSATLNGHNSFILTPFWANELSNFLTLQML